METYTIPEAAEITGLAPREVRIALETGRLRAVRTGGRWRIPRYELVRAGMVEDGDPARPDSRLDPEPEPVAAVTPLAPPPDTDTEEAPASEEQVGLLQERLADLERRLEELEGMADRSSREASMREALAPLFSDPERSAVGHRGSEPPPGEPRFRAPR
jgi:excisionase family DNA binding protein